MDNFYDHNGPAFSEGKDTVLQREKIAKDYLEKKDNECVLLYPEECVPAGKTLDDVVNLFTDKKTVIYTEKTKGIKPSLIGGETAKAKVKFIKLA